MTALQRYLKTLVALLALLMLLNIGFNLLVDPFNAWQVIKVDGVNAIKSRAYKYERIAKPAMVERMQPERIFIGTSRTEYTLSSDAPVLQQQPPMTTLNLAMRSANINEIMLMFQHAVSQAPVREAVIGLELPSFSYIGSPGTEELADYVVRDWRGQRNHGYRLYQFRDTLFALDVTSNSGKTLQRQSEDDRNMADDGRYLAERNIPVLMEDGGIRVNFSYWLGEFTQGAWTICRNGRVFFEADERFDAMARFRDILMIAAQHDIELKLYISPSHATLMEAMWQSGVWPASEHWKQLMVKVVDEVNLEYNTDFAIIDFEAIDAISTETIPPAGDQQTTMQYFLDPAHFTRALGDRILAHLYQDGDSDWGTRLNSTLLDNHLQQLRQDLRRWAQQNPSEQQYVQQIVDVRQPQRKDFRRCNTTLEP